MLSEKAQKVFDAVCEDPDGLQSRDVFNRTQVNHRTCMAALRAMRAIGLIERDKDMNWYNPYTRNTRGAEHERPRENCGANQEDHGENEEGRERSRG